MKETIFRLNVLKGILICTASFLTSKSFVKDVLIGAVYLEYISLNNTISTNLDRNGLRIVLDN